jgi:hypothetical protein
MPVISTIGESTLFFSTNDKDKLWRHKEKIVAVIESYLQGKDDIFTYSSVKAKDIIGYSEQVDVAYTTIQDPMKLFSFVEVRDRSIQTGRQYIQEIMGKRTSLGINTCKVVSTKGFSRNAIRLASNQNITLRQLLPETEQKIKTWFKPDYLHIFVNKQVVIARISERYKYIDVISQEEIAQLLLAKFKVAEKQFNIVLLRYGCNEGGCQLGGAIYE